MADVEIRKQTKNKKCLQDALRAIVDAGGTIDHDWPIARAFEVGDKATGTHVLSEMYAKWSVSPVTVDLPGLWKELGIRRVSDDGIELDAKAPLAEVRKRNYSKEVGAVENSPTGLRRGITSYKPTYQDPGKMMQCPMVCASSEESKELPQDQGKGCGVSFMNSPQRPMTSLMASNNQQPREASAQDNVRQVLCPQATEPPSHSKSDRDQQRELHINMSRLVVRRERKDADGQQQCRDGCTLRSLLGHAVKRIRAGIRNAPPPMPMVPEMTPMT